jgi:hypothetical protein
MRSVLAVIVGFAALAAGGIFLGGKLARHGHP